MKSTSIKVRTTVDKISPPLEPKEPVSGSRLGDKLSDLPIGFYTNVNKNWTGIIFRDRFGKTTYFDKTSGTIYPFDGENTWSMDFFEFQPDLKSVSVTLI